MKRRREPRESPGHGGGCEQDGQHAARTAQVGREGACKAAVHCEQAAQAEQRLVRCSVELVGWGVVCASTLRRAGVSSTGACRCE